MHVDVAARGAVSDRDVEAARAKVGALDRVIDRPILGAHVVLTFHSNPRLLRPALAEGEINVDGRPVRGRVGAPTMTVAVDELAEHLHRRRRDHMERLQDRSRRPAEPEPGEWSHGSWSPPRPDHFPRPPAEREIVRRKSFALASESVFQAMADLDALDHDFFLFHDAERDCDAVLYRRDDGGLGLIGPVEPPAAAGLHWEPSRVSEPIDVETARAELDLDDDGFLFFVNRATGRGAVLYLRYDGHYGLIEPAT